LWHLGYPDQALQRSREALILAQELTYPFSLVWALNITAAIHQYRREGHPAQERAEAVMARSTAQGFPYWLALGTIWWGSALAEQGRMEEGIEQMRQGQAAYQATGAKLGQSQHLALLAEACGKGGHAEEGLKLLAEALEVVHEIGERHRQAELYRLKGELRLAQSSVQSLESRVKEAEGCFLKAIEIARRQQAKSLELRATTSLARLWQSQGKKIEAHQMLSEIYSWFTEGFDTKDLREAKTLLDVLSEGD